MSVIIENATCPLRPRLRGPSACLDPYSIRQKTTSHSRYSRTVTSVVVLDENTGTRLTLLSYLP
jgi:hypothetical protein